MPNVSLIAKMITVKIDGANTGAGAIVDRHRDRYIVLSNWHLVGSSDKSSASKSTIDLRTGTTNSALGIDVNRYLQASGEVPRRSWIERPAIHNSSCFRHSQLTSRPCGLIISAIALVATVAKLY